MAPPPSSTPNITRKSLLIQLRPGHPRRELAWTEFEGLYAPIISGFARRMGANATQAKDLVQDVLHAFFAISPQFVYDPAKGRFRGYLKTCVWHKLSQLRRQSQGQVQSLGGVGRRGSGSGSHADDEAAVEAAVEATWNDVWETEKLHRALAVVRERYANNPDRQRTYEAFEMCVLLERSTESVAAALGMSVESVRQAKSRVSKALHETFDHLDNTTG
ncbi:MAG: sigma-70 family RNA polymerase sigma factor [Phycisphaerales bacterium]|jgi:RNA polymerase sigma-70 factor (ECF subfamily)|nr:sigma-70 family RNA polymerase sigma factor [Phycisphaerales bacterium]